MGHASLNGAKRPRGVVDRQQGLLYSVLLILLFMLMAALTANFAFWVRLMRQEEESQSRGERIRYISVRPQFDVKMDTRNKWMSKAFLGGQIYLPDDVSHFEARPVAKTKHGLLVDEQQDIRRLCMCKQQLWYGERCSGTTWVNSLLMRNFILEIDEAACPNKHDYENTVPNEFLFPGADTLIVTVFRNAFDWAASFYKTPWGAANHCNVTFETFLTREWAPGDLKGTHPYCPKYEDGEANYMHTTIAMYYEATHGHHPADVMELRRWKLQRQVDFCRMRAQSACVQYEGVLADWRDWLIHMRDKFNLQTKPGFPTQVDHYKGLKDHELFKPHSHYTSLMSGEHTPLYNASTIPLVQQRLDLRLEASLGYQYAGISAAAEKLPLAGQSMSRRLWHRS